MKKHKQKLVDIFESISKEDQSHLLSYAEYLHDKTPKKEIPKTPLDIPRPERENVVQAVKRLSKTYPMIPAGKMLNETSRLMSEHMIQGKSAKDVIIELEQVFLDTYTTLSKKKESEDESIS